MGCSKSKPDVPATPVALEANEKAAGAVDDKVEAELSEAATEERSAKKKSKAEAKEAAKAEREASKKAKKAAKGKKKDATPPASEPSSEEAPDAEKEKEEAERLEKERLEKQADRERQLAAFEEQRRKDEARRERRLEKERALQEKEAREMAEMITTGACMSIQAAVRGRLARQRLAVTGDERMAAVLSKGWKMRSEREQKEAAAPAVSAEAKKVARSNSFKLRASKNRVQRAKTANIEKLQRRVSGDSSDGSQRRVSGESSDGSPVSSPNLSVGSRRPSALTSPGAESTGSAASIPTPAASPMEVSLPPTANERV